MFSIAVQHGGYKTIFREARNLITDHTPEDQILALYTARGAYIQGMPLSNNIKEALINRYAKELTDVLELYNQEDKKD